jgi:hypothetical protein
MLIEVSMVKLPKRLSYTEPKRLALLRLGNSRAGEKSVEDESFSVDALIDGLIEREGGT